MERLTDRKANSVLLPRRAVFYLLPLQNKASHWSKTVLFVTCMLLTGSRQAQQCGGPTWTLTWPVKVLPSLTVICPSSVARPLRSAISFGSSPVNSGASPGFIRNTCTQSRFRTAIYCAAAVYL